MVAFITHGCKILQNATILLRSKFAQVINIYLPLIKVYINDFYKTIYFYIILHNKNTIVLYLCCKKRFFINFE